MRKIIPLLTLILGLTSAARADEITNQLESLLKPQDAGIRQRLTRFFTKHKVKRPNMYARLLADHPMPERKKKILAAILVPESRGNSNAVSSEGATGSWQVMPFWKRKLRIKGSLKDPRINLVAASQVYDIPAEGHSEWRALYEYSGKSRWYPDRVLNLAKEI